MKLGIIAALHEEIKSLTPQIIETGNSAWLKDKICIFHSGVGRNCAGHAANRLVEQGASALLSWGCAAGLDRKLKPGNLLLPERIISKDGRIFQADGDWHKRFINNLAGKVSIYKDALVESDQIITDPAQKKNLCTQSQAIAADMESAAIAEVAEKNKLSFLVIRAIADTSKCGIPNCVTQSQDGRGEIKKLLLLKNAFMHPADWIPLIVLAQQFLAAHKTLKQVISNSPSDFYCEEPLR